MSICTCEGGPYPTFGGHADGCPRLLTDDPGCNCGATLKHSADCMMFWAPLPRRAVLDDITNRDCREPDSLADVPADWL